MDVSRDRVVFHAPGWQRHSVCNSDYLDVQRFKAAIEQVAIKKDAAPQQLLVRFSKVRNVTAVEASLQDGNGALDSKPLPLCELTCAMIVKDHEVCSSFLREYQRADLAESETE